MADETSHGQRVTNAVGTVTKRACEDAELIAGSQTDEVSACRLKLLSEGDYARLMEKSGVAVYEHKARFWRNSSQLGSLLLVPVHWMAQLTPEQATFPRLSTLVIKARVTDPRRSNASFDLYMIQNPEAYGLESMKPSARNHVRRSCREGVEIRLATHELLEEHGYEVIEAALETSGHRRPPRKRDFVRGLEDVTFMGGNRLVLAGMVPGDGHREYLGAIATGSVVDGTAYGDDLYIAPWARRSNVGSRIVYAFIQACQRTEGVRRIVLGRATDDEALDSFKRSLGFERQAVPARVAFRPTAALGARVVLAVRPAFRQRLYGA